MKKSTGIKLALASAVLAGSTYTIAATQDINATAKWVATVALSSPVDINFGSLDVGAADGATVVVDTANSITDSSNIQTGSTAVGSVTIAAGIGETISIGIAVVDSDTGFDTSNFTCSYNSGSEAGCDTADAWTQTAVASDAMEIGATITVATAETITAGDTESEVVTVTVNYN